MRYKIYPLYCGANTIVKSKLFYQGTPAAETVEMQYACFLLQSEAGEYMMVDSGCPLPRHITENDYADVYAIRANAPESMETLLAQHGVRPEQITKIFLTHLHYDHAWNLWCYPNAKIYVQRREMQAAVLPMSVPSELRAYATIGKVLKFTWFNSLDRIVPVDGAAELAPGVRCILTPGHSAGGQTIIVETAEGTYAFPGDYAPCLENITECRPVGMLLNMQAWFDAYPAVKELLDSGVKFLPNHDPRSFERPVYG